MSAEILYFSDIGFQNKPTDSPGNVYWVKRIDVPYSVSTSLFSGTQIGGLSDSSAGSITLANDDGALDYLDNLDWLNADAVIYFSPLESPQFTDFSVVFSGKTERCVPGDNFVIELRDRKIIFDSPYQSSIFTGAGGLEGPPEFAGRRKPRLLGRNRQFEPVLLNIALSIYCYGSGPSGGIISARDGGLALTAGTNHASYDALAAATILPGQYHTCNALSLIRLGSPLGQVLTLDADGVSVSSVVQRRFGDLFLYIVSADAGLNSSDFVPNTINLSNSQAPQELNHWYDGSQEIKVRDVLDYLAQSVLGYYSVDSLGKISLGLIDEPSSALLSLEERQIYEMTPTPVERRLKRQVVRYNRKYRPLQSTELIGVVQESLKSDFQREWDIAESEFVLANPLANTETIDTGLTSYADALAHAQKRIQLFSPIRKTYSIETSLDTSFKVGDSVLITYSRFGLQNGKDFLILEISPNAEDETMTLEVWG